jgi:hypothetical protein
VSIQVKYFLGPAKTKKYRSNRTENLPDLKSGAKKRPVPAFYVPKAGTGLAN